jgi:hypothetical protein
MMDPHLFARFSQLSKDERWTLAQNDLLAASSEPLVIIDEPAAEVRASILAQLANLPAEQKGPVLLPSTTVGQTFVVFPDWQELGFFVARALETETERLLVRGIGHAYAIWGKVHGKVAPTYSE